ncbi:hypothetical protein F511_27549 [Dorcoceras hygrometricum]|uniref:GDSL esterase/lipase-like n=1 Tax=Dorcoceras hygrometricum TaxID=472368 RepID=A0A2Z7A1B7_9LAMI|nr:hypothetical protein F511_27549 [Dorcoceras hygrometricum]
MTVGWEDSGDTGGSSGLIRRSVLWVATGLGLLAAISLLRNRQTLGKSTSVCAFSGIYNFGDSNSDTGSFSAALLPVASPNGRTFFGKPSGRFSDGRLIIDFIAENLGLQYLPAYLDSFGVDFRHGANFASAGSTIQRVCVNTCMVYNPFSLDVQLLQFEQFQLRSIETNRQGSESFSRALYTIDSGQNDLTAGIGSSRNMEEVKADIPRILDQFSVALEKLYKLGARAFWIHNTGPIGCLPYFVVGHRTADRSNTDSNGCIKSYNEVAQEFNKQLKDRIIDLRSQLRDAILIYVDIYSVKHSLISNRNNNGFRHPLGYCCGRLVVVGCGGKTMWNGTEVYGNSCRNPSEYISWDGTHYTEAANKWISSRILDGSFSEPKVPIGEACFRTS